MRVAVAVAVVCASSVAYADLKRDVERLVTTNIQAVAADRFAAFDRTVSGGRVLVLPDGKTAIDQGLVADFYGPGAKRVKHRVESLHVIVDASKQLAWFHGAFVATYTAGKKQVKLPMRITGIAADEGAPVGWKLQALMYARTLPDRELFARAVAAEPGTAKTTGDAAAAKLVAGWFGGGTIADDRSKNVAVAVNGTTPLELGKGVYAVKLVKAWDALKLWATSIEATVFAKGEIAFVRADVMIPVKERASAVVLGVVLVKENATWRWVALSFTPAV